MKISALAAVLALASNKAFAHGDAIGHTHVGGSSVGPAEVAVFIAVVVGLFWIASRTSRHAAEYATVKSRAKQ